MDVQIGRLNLLTPKRVKAAASEIKTGEIVPLEYVRIFVYDGQLETNVYLQPPAQCP